MDLSGIALLAFAAAAILAVRWIARRMRIRRTRFVPTNDLERLLARSLGTTDLSPEMRAMLSSAVLLAIESPVPSKVPMTFSAIFPADFGGPYDERNLTPDGKVQFGPWVVCFSSMRVVKGVAADPVVRPLVTQLGEIREYPAREIFQSAIDRQLDVVLNPFFGVRRRLSLDEAREILATEA